MLTTRLRAGTILDAAAPRGDFVLGGGTGPVLLISAGIGLTPVLSMLHQLAADRSTREIWWIHGARGPLEHPLAAEAHALLASLPRASEHVFYSAATPGDSRGRNVVPGRLSRDSLATLGIAADASAYICGPAAFMADMQVRSRSWVLTRHAFTPSCSACCLRSTPASPDRPAGRRTCRRGRREPGRWYPSPAPASPCRSPTASAACWISPTLATFLPAGAVALASVTPASRTCSPGR